MSIAVDARGLPCPQPVIRTRRAMREGDDILTLVSGEDQMENVRRLAEKQGWLVTVEDTDDGYALRMVRQGATQEPAPALGMLDQSSATGVALVVSSECMGSGSDELGAILIRAFFHTLTEVDSPPSTIVFYNTGVKIAVEGSPIAQDLVDLEARGVEILACGTCVNYFGLQGRLAAGSVSNMYTIADTLLGASRVVSP